MINEVSPPGWGHTKAEKEKTKPEKPKSKIGGTAHAMKLAQKRGDIPKNMNIFALMWSMKNKGDKPHYKPGVKDKLKGKYKGPEGQNEMIDPKKIRNYKNVSNAVVAKADKEAEKVKDKEQKGTLEFPQMPTEESTEPDEMIQKVVEYIKTNGKRRKTDGGDGRRKENHEDVEEATAGELELANAKKKQKLSITPAGEKALKKGDPKSKLSITKKGLDAIKDEVEMDEKMTPQQRRSREGMRGSNPSDTTSARKGGAMVPARGDYSKTYDRDKQFKKNIGPQGSRKSHEAERGVEKVRGAKEEYEIDEKNWIKGAIKKPGALHRDLDVPQGEKIPAGKLKAAAKEGGKVGQRARLAQTLKKMHNEYFPEDDKGKPEQGKLYALTGRSDQPSIARGDSWKKSVVTKKRKEQDAKKND